VNHRLNIQHALFSLFETPVQENDNVSRAVLTQILAKQDIDFDKPIIDISANPHFFGLARAGVLCPPQPCVPDIASGGSCAEGLYCGGGGGGSAS
jgi:hypothetical protein